MERSYSELIKLSSYGDRLEYLKLGDGNVKSPRHISNHFYKSKEWREFRSLISARDLMNDLGVPGHPINGTFLIHHINPIDEYDIINRTQKLMDPENVITTIIETHGYIHYKEEMEDVERKPGDTTLW